MYQHYFKRLLDCLLSFITILILSPLLLFIALMIRIKLGSPILYIKGRPGKNEHIFFMYKFRTMKNILDEDGQLLPDDMRLTKFGWFLRSTSLDELPELFNILKGEMSIVGPRPLDVKYLSFYSEEERLRHNVKPGLTGLAQVNGRNGLNWEEKFAYDIEYVNRITFKSDVKIILKTILKVLIRENIGTRGDEMMEDFDKYRIRQNEVQYKR